MRGTKWTFSEFCPCPDSQNRDILGTVSPEFVRPNFYFGTGTFSESVPRVCPSRDMDILGVFPSLSVQIRKIGTKGTDKPILLRNIACPCP